jgi:SNF2 family DNA or RNA helicase
VTALPFTPWEYQKLGIEFLLDVPRCALWADMGMGKSVVTLSVLEYLRLAGDDKPALIVAPLRVARGVWPAEARKWAHLRDYRVQPVTGTDKQRRAALRQPADAYTINLENMKWLFGYLLEHDITWPFETVVIDESTRLKSMRVSEQTSKLGKKFIRAAGAVRARQLARIAHSHVKRWINLTGTPSPNGLQDLWGQTWFLDKGVRLGRTYDAFTQRWFQRKFDGYGVEPLPYTNEQIHDRLRDVCLSIRAEDYFDIREPHITTVRVDLPPKARKIYRDMEREMFAQIATGVEVEAFNAAAKTNKCLQLAAGFIYHEDGKTWTEVHNDKLDALESIIEETSGAPLLIQYHYKPDLARILKRFPDARHLQTQKDEDDWNAGKISKLVAHAGSAGHGLNLQDGGHILVRYSYWWALEQFEQILERIGPVRQAQSGHDRVVHEYRIVARDTVDEDVIARNESKRDVQDILMKAMARRAA